MSERVQIPMKTVTAQERSLKPATSATLLRRCACGSTGGGGGECADCRKKKLQRSAAGNAPEFAPSIVHEVLGSPGQSLDSASRNFFESRFGHDFSRVRIHADERASESAQSVNALAYTVGPHIAFASGLYQPRTASGQRLLAHELTHVVQQDKEASPAGPIQIGPEDDEFERQADQSSVLLPQRQGAEPAHAPGAAAISLQRACGPQKIGSPGACTTSSTDPGGKHYRFRVNCDEFLEDEEEQQLRTFAAALPNDSIVNIHGFASIEGDPEFNLNLSCARAIKAQSIIQEILNTAGRKATFKLFQHGGTAGDRADRRSVAVEASGAPKPYRPKPEPEPTPGPCGPGTDDPFCFHLPGETEPCKPYLSADHALSVWASLESQIPLGAAAATRCPAIKPVWDEYFAAKGTPFPPFDNPSSCVVQAAKKDPDASQTTERAVKGLLQDIVDYLPNTLRQAPPASSPLLFMPVTLRMQLAEAIEFRSKIDLHPMIIYNDPFNAAANIAGAVGPNEPGEDRLMGGPVVIEISDLNPNAMSGEVRWLPHVHVDDVVRFCPAGNLGNWWQRKYTLPLSKLEATGLVKPVPIKIDYDLDLQQMSFRNVAPLTGPESPSAAEGSES